jgi:hypothetical protein
MDNIVYSDEYALSLLELVNENLDNMNRYTDEILICSYDELEDNIKQRDICFENVKKNYEKLKKFRTFENEQFSAVMSDTADYNSLTGIMKEISDERRKMIKLSNEITSKDIYVNQKLSECKDEMLIRIKKLNSATESKASRYYSSGINSGNIYIPKRNKKI